MERKTVFVTGSSRGIGRSIALQFAKMGYQIVLNARTASDALSETANAIQALGMPYLTCIGDIGDYSTVQQFFQKIKETFGTVDILINNAGISQIGLLSELSKEEWDRILQTNLSSVFYCCKFAIPDMVAKKQGKIIMISSVWGNVGASCEVAYSASKSGVHGFTRALAKELAPSNIQVNALACGVIDTAMNASFCEAERLALKEEIPANRFATPDEVASFVFQLATSPSYLTGQIIPFDGGWC